jgi:hypothetical protein
MKTYRIDQETKDLILHRCDFEAGKGRVAQALERIADLRREFPDDADCMNTEGFLRFGYLGQGVAASDLFYRAWKANPDLVDAAQGYLRLAGTLHEWRLRMEQTKDLHGHAGFGKLDEEVKESLSKGVPFRDLVLIQVEVLAQKRCFGMAAALIEILLSTTGNGEVETETQPGWFHYIRGYYLRSLDREAEERLAGAQQRFLPRERLALFSAVEEMRKAVAEDPYDAERWNFLSAWLMGLDRDREAIDAARESIKLRPSGYPKPFQNIASSQWKMGSRTEAVATMQQARREALASGDSGDLSNIDKFLEDAAQFHPDAMPDVEELSRLIINRAMLYSETEESRDNRCDPRENLRRLEEGFLKRVGLVGYDDPEAYVYMATELLAMVSPETFLFVQKLASTRDPRAANCLLHGVRHLAAHAEGCVRTDATRVLVLVAIDRLKLNGIRSAYRQMVLEPASRDAAFADLDRRCREEMERYSEHLPSLITDCRSWLGRLFHAFR